MVKNRLVRIKKKKRRKMKGYFIYYKIKKKEIKRIFNLIYNLKVFFVVVLKIYY